MWFAPFAILGWLVGCKCNRNRNAKSVTAEYEDLWLLFGLVYDSKGSSLKDLARRWDLLTFSLLFSAAPHTERNGLTQSRVQTQSINKSRLHNDALPRSKARLILAGLGGLAICSAQFGPL